MCNDRSNNSSDALHERVRPGFRPGNTVLYCLSECDSGIQVSSRDWPEGQNQRYQRRARRNRVRQQGDGDIPARQPFTHDAGTDHGRDKKCCAEKLSRQPGTEVEGHWCPMVLISLSMASLSILARGNSRNRPIRRSRIIKAPRYARSTSSADPVTAAGSRTPQWAVKGCPGQIGQTSLAALSQTVNTKSRWGASGPANSSQLLLLSPSVGR